MKYFNCHLKQDEKIKAVFSEQNITEEMKSFWDVLGETKAPENNGFLVPTTPKKETPEERKATEAYDAHYLEAARAFSKLGLTAEQIVAVSADYPTLIKTGNLQDEIDWIKENI
jgi:hypothetical protein